MAKHKGKLIDLLEFYCPGIEIKFGINPRKVSLYRQKRLIIIDRNYAHRNFVVLLYLCYTVLLMKECEQDVCIADKKAIDKLIEEGHRVDKQFYLDLLQILSDKNELRVQMIKERIQALPYGGS